MPNHHGQESSRVGLGPADLLRVALRGGLPACDGAHRTPADAVEGADEARRLPVNNSIRRTLLDSRSDRRPEVAQTLQRLVTDIRFGPTWVMGDPGAQ